ncbi:hypothetical protein RB614_43950 [Phytohabitans sp. ZYX-F-186]|uniref:DUF5666 domain-containing protein n=1 Tax=Phytohabitans maris TaxID=3071409 RepID=A0ABU0ZWP5_9ACTN|nr:hypothetical protein [Phytohabitans sp. ZYX-F-186]MDQ7911461.1 hypothetical protein [Phytohabitans sp. ZYX-F-186]
MKRLGLVLASGVLAFGLVGCGGAAVQEAGETAVEVAAAMGAEGQALAAMGMDPSPAASPSDSPSAAPDRKDRRERRKARVLLRKNVLHGEAVVQTKDGTKTVAVQRGEVTQIDDDSITVKSTDGYTATWTFASDLHVVRHSTTVQPEEIEAGTKVGVAGAKDGDGFVARLIVVPRS